MPNNEIKIRDKRKLNPLTKKPINPRRDLKSMNADANMIKNIYNTARDYKLDPNLMLAIGLQESNLGKTDANNPFRVNAIYHGISEDPMAQGVAIFRDKYNKNPKMSEAHRIQAYNGLTKKTRANPDYGNQVISLRDSVIKQSPELQNYMTKLDSAYNAYNQPMKKRPQTNLKKLNPFQQALFGLTGSTFENGGKIEPYITNNPNDPRIQAYKDSSDLYNDYNRIKQDLTNKKYKLENENDSGYFIDSNFSRGLRKALHIDENVSKYDMALKNPKKYEVENINDRMFRVGDLDPALINTSIKKQLASKYIKPIGQSSYVDSNTLYPWSDIPSEYKYNGKGIMLGKDRRTIFNYKNVKPVQQVILNKPQSKQASKAIGQTRSKKIDVPKKKVSRPLEVLPVERIKVTNISQITPQAQTPINTGSQTPITLGISSPDSSTGKRLYRYGNKDISEQEFNKYKTLGQHKIVEYGFGGQVGSILSTVSPFLNLIPGAGTIAAPIAGMAGTVLQSIDQNSQMQNRHEKSPYLQPLPNNYSKTGYESGGIIINEGNGIEHAYGNSHEEGGIQYNQGAEIEGGEKVLDNNYVLTDQPDSNLDKTQISIAKRFDKDHKAISNRNSNAVIDKAKEYLKQDAIMKNEKYLQARHQKMMDKIGKVVKKYGGDLESLSAELGVYKEGGSGIWGTPMNQRQQTTTFDPSQVPVYLDRYKAALQNTPINNNKSRSGNSQYQDIYPRYQDALYPANQTLINQPLSQGIQQYDTPDYDTRPNNINSRRLPANTPNKTNTRTGTKVNKAVIPVEVPQQMNPIQVQNVNNQRISSNQDSGFRFYQDPGSQLYPAVPGGNYSGSYTDPYRQSVPERVNQSPENGIPYRYNDQMNSSSSNQPSSFNYGRLAETIGTYAPGIYNLARGLFDKPDYMNSADYTIPQQQANLIPTNTGENEIRDAYTRSLYDMRNSGAYSKLGQVNLANQRAKNNYERKLQLASANAQIRNQVASQNSNINAQNAQMKQGVYDWNARSRAQKGNFVGQGISDLSTGIQNERNYRNDLTGIYSSFDNPTTRNYLESIGYRVPNRYKRGQ